MRNLTSAAHYGALTCARMPPWPPSGWPRLGWDPNANTAKRVLSVPDIGDRLAAGPLYWRFGPRRLITAGLLVVAGTLVLMAQAGPGTSLWLVRLIMFALGIGVSLVFIPNQAASMATITKAQTGRASSIFNAGKQLGGAGGVALLSTVLAAAGPTQERAGHLTANIGAYHDGFLAAAAVALISVLVALTVRDRDAAATMVPRQRRRAGQQADEPALAARAR